MHLPRFFHATDSFSSILCDKQIRQGPAFNGRGAYISSKNEGKNYAISLAAEAVYSSPGTYLLGPQCEHLQTHSLWVRVQKDIQIGHKDDDSSNLLNQGVAHFVVPQEDMGTKKVFKKTHEWRVPAISTNANTCIAQLFDKVMISRPLPKQWKPLNGDRSCPNNFVPHSNQTA